MQRSVKILILNQKGMIEKVYESVDDGSLSNVKFSKRLKKKRFHAFKV